LLIVYIVWSTTYLAIRIAVTPGSGFAPFAMGAGRLLMASVILLLLARLQGERITLSKSELFLAMITGVFLWVGGNGLVMWAEQSADSSFAALMMASEPMWVVVINAFMQRQRPSWLVAGSLGLGFGGVVVLMLPSLGGTGTGLAATIALLTAAVSWSLGSVFQARRKVELSVLVISAYQQLFAGIGMLLIMFALGEPRPDPTLHAWMAWAYLVVFGSVLAFTSYIQTLKLLPINIAMTYSYVNPVLALILGWLLLGENITAYTIAGTLMVVLGVVGVFRGQA
jgi:drug/metabolite transporter (DMT)-like permease